MDRSGPPSSPGASNPAANRTASRRQTLHWHPTHPHVPPNVADNVPASTRHHRSPHKNVINVEAALSQRRRYLTAKRVGDALIVIVASPLWIPLLMIAWLAVRIFDGAPAVFTQERVGLNGRTFTMYKLRTMRVDAERNGAAFAGQADPRITRIGAFLRRTRIDELPQLLNVLKGDMSLIGPRPEQLEFVRQFERSIPGYELRHRVRPGITGLAQVNQGYVADEDGTVTKVRHDLAYMSQVSLHLDTRIALRTVLVMLVGWGAR